MSASPTTSPDAVELYRSVRDSGCSVNDCINALKNNNYSMDQCGFAVKIVEKVNLTTAKNVIYLSNAWRDDVFSSQEQFIGALDYVKRTDSIATALLEL